jgi:hypothetical protein
MDDLHSVVQLCPLKRAFERLEPCAIKVARTVLRGGDGSNAISLPDLSPDGSYCLLDAVKVNHLLVRSACLPLLDEIL